MQLKRNIVTQDLSRHQEDIESVVLLHWLFAALEDAIDLPALGLACPDRNMSESKRFQSAGVPASSPKPLS